MMTKSNFLLFTCLFLSFALSTLAIRTIPVKDQDNILLTFGSCNRYYGDEPDDIFYRIADMKPDAWIWLGDVAYVDEKIMPPIFGYAGEAKIKEKLDSAKNSPPYAHLRNTTEIIGVWDDHDYGLNNAGKNFQHKNLTQQLWLDFLDEPKNSPRRKQAGLYESYYIGNSSRIKVILLDVRYFKEPSSIFKPNGTDLLGSEQWEWLEKELKENTAEYVVIGSGIQIIPDDRLVPEHWYSGNRDRLFALIRKYKTSGVILISGDVHFAEILKYPCREHVGYEIYEFTSSGLTHHVSTHVPFADKYMDVMVPKTWSTKKDRFLDLNFGVLKFSFGKERKVKFEARDVNSTVVLEKTLRAAELRYNKQVVNPEAQCVGQKNKYVRFLKNFCGSLLRREWLAYVILLLVVFVAWLLVKLVKLPFKLIGIFFREPKKQQKQKQE